MQLQMTQKILVYQYKEMLEVFIQIFSVVGLFHKYFLQDYQYNISIIMGQAQHV